MIKNNVKNNTRISSTKRADVLFSVPRCRKILRELVGSKKKWRIPMKTSIYIAAVMTYMTAELLELAGNAARQSEKSRISPRNINFAIRGDQEMYDLLQKVVIRDAGVIPHIHRTMTLKHPSRIADFVDFPAAIIRSEAVEVEKLNENSFKSQGKKKSKKSSKSDANKLN